MSKETKKELSKIAGELQAKFGRRIDFDETLRFLVHMYRARKRKKALFEKFTEPIKDLSFDDAYIELVEGRNKDERKLQRYISP